MTRSESSATERPEPADGAALWRAWRTAAADGDALCALHEQLAAELARRGPVCQLSGRCCRFDSFGHRLYVTGLEIAWMLGQLDETARRRLIEAPLPAVDGCPFQVEQLCSVHAIRPLGCRIFFCDPDAQAWQGSLYEQYHHEVRQLHDRCGIAYRYLEWRDGLHQAQQHLMQPTL